MLEKAVTSQLKEDTEATGVRKLFGKDRVCTLKPSRIVCVRWYECGGNDYQTRKRRIMELTFLWWWIVQAGLQDSTERYLYLIE